jgi:RTX calcium-binding nonapeptide repeat (4 copies)/WD40-like Beta Propeller Repeat
MTKLSATLALTVVIVLAGSSIGSGQVPAPGLLIAYSVSHPMPNGLETRHICLVDWRTTRTQLLTSERYVADSLPTWSPDGARVAFTRAFYSEAQTSNIFTVDPRTFRRRLVPRDGSNLAPDWSPDGRRIAYIHGYRGFDLRVMNADGSRRRSLGPSGQVYGPSWSHDGAQIAFTKNELGRAAIWTVGADGRGERLLIDDAAEPDWSLDGRTIAFTRRGSDRTRHIWVASADGTEQRPSTFGDTYDSAPAYGPPQLGLVFERSGDLYHLHGTAPELLVGTRLQEQFPSWGGGVPGARITGSPCSILGEESAERLVGTASTDYIYGGPGRDAIVAGRGRDVALGEAGNDRVFGGNGSDALGGGPGADRLFGGRGSDALYGGPGADLLVGGAGSDIFRCGPGRDRVVLEGRERATRNCEVRIRSR